jgi:hypothetical protein
MNAHEPPEPSNRGLGNGSFTLEVNSLTYYLALNPDFHPTGAGIFGPGLVVRFSVKADWHLPSSPKQWEPTAATYASRTMKVVLFAHIGAHDMHDHIEIIPLR